MSEGDRECCRGAMAISFGGAIREESLESLGPLSLVGRARRRDGDLTPRHVTRSLQKGGERGRRKDSSRSMDCFEYLKCKVRKYNVTLCPFNNNPGVPPHR